jgi:hypothetical protein
MAPAEELPLPNEPSVWMRLSSLAEELKNSSDWIFRGQRRVEWPLTPSIGRKGARKAFDGVPLPYSADQERRALSEFSRRVAASRNLSRPFDILCFGQHHGLPTRLLDWTRNLFAAAYFACQHGGAEPNPQELPTDAAIFGVRGLPFLSPERDPFSLAGNDVCLAYPYEVSPRIIAQRSVFSVHGSPDIPLTDCSLSGVQVRKWRLPREALMDVKLCLDLVGVNEASLFPDEDGLARYIGWAYKRDRLPSF